jgi:rhodanese-related sulfurtransferase
MAQGEMPALPRDEEIVITCASGYRSTVAASLLLAHGYQHLRNLGGGMNAWNERKAGSRSVAS